LLVSVLKGTLGMPCLQNKVCGFVYTPPVGDVPASEKAQRKKSHAWRTKRSCETFTSTDT
jgi:hypothetical protein